MQIRFLVPHRVASELLQHTPTIYKKRVHYQFEWGGLAKSRRRGNVCCLRYNF